MSRLLTRAVRLLKFGAVAGALVGVGRLVMRQRRKSEAVESSWPTIAETAAQNGQPVDDPSEAVEADSPEVPADHAGEDSAGDADDD